jgi:hypothetical protein
MALHPIPLNFLIVEENFILFFIGVLYVGINNILSLLCFDISLQSTSTYSFLPVYVWRERILTELF